MPDPTNDHDLLIELRVELKALRVDVRDLKDNFKTRLDDHEGRIRTLESADNQSKGRERGIAAFIALLISAALEAAYHIIRH